MSKTTKKDTPESPSQASADASGLQEAVTVDDLSVVVMHMKKSNEWVKKTNLELIKFNKGQAGQNKWLRVISLLLTVFIGVLGYGLWLDHKDSEVLTAELVETNKRLDVVVLELKDTHQAAKDMKKVVEAQPIITIKPADITDPTSRPTLVVQPKPMPLLEHHDEEDGLKQKLSKPAVIEIPFDPPKKKKK